MAGVTLRNKTWYAYWTGPDGRTVMRTTKIKVAYAGKSKKQTKKLAKNAADLLENTAKGISTLDKAVTMFRSLAEEQGFAKPIPTIEEYLHNFPAQASPKFEQQRQRTFKVFLEQLGEDAKLAITEITSVHIRKHLLWLLQNYRKGTVLRRREHLASAFNRAVDVDHFFIHSPMREVKLHQLMKSIGVEDDTVVRKPFSVEELKTILNRFPQPYCDLAAASFYTGGLRLGDVCLLRWADVDFEKNGIFIKEQKTKKPRFIQLIPVLRERLLARKAEQEDGETYVFPETARKYLYSPGTVSTDFTTLLKAFDICTREEDKTALKGRRRAVTTKCFHSIRHSFVSIARSNPNLSRDVVRETVGHSSEAIEMGFYFTAEDKAKRQVLESVAGMVETPAAKRSTDVAE